MRKIAPFIHTLICYLFIILFIYAAVSKLMDFENFQIQLAQSPLLSAYAGFISYAVIIVEIVIVLLLCIKQTQQIGLYASYGLMLAFTVYIYLIINYSDFVPCSCGGILEKLGWTEHLIFNLVFVGLAVIAIYLCKTAIYQKSKRKLFVNFFAISIVSIGSVIMLFLTSEHIIKQENNFTRRFIPHAIKNRTSINLGANSYYYAGYNDNVIFLGNYTSPSLVTLVDLNLTKITTKKYKLEYPHQAKNIKIQILNNSIFSFDGSSSLIYSGKLTDSISKCISYPKMYYNQIIAIDSSNFIIKSLHSKTKNQTLGIISLNNIPYLKLKPNILNKQIDGTFDLDGLLLVDPITNKILHFYHYRNQIMVMDKNLNVIHQLKTIDTISKAKIETKKMKNGINKLSNPPLLVNKKGFYYNDYFYNLSNLRGLYEPLTKWEKGDIIDVYDTQQQLYKGSFFVPKYKENSITSFFIIQNFLYIHTENELIRYQMTSSITN